MFSPQGCSFSPYALYQKKRGSKVGKGGSHCLRPDCMEDYYRDLNGKLKSRTGEQREGQRFHRLPLRHSVLSPHHTLRPNSSDGYFFSTAGQADYCAYVKKTLTNP